MDYSEVDTIIATNWRQLLGRAENGDALFIPDLLNGNQSPEACLLKGYALYTAEPEVAKDLFAQAKRSPDIELSHEAAVFEARCYEYLGQYDEGKILIRALLRRSLSPTVKAHAMFVFSVLQVGTPKRALKTLNSINLDHVSVARRARIFYWRAKLEADLAQYDRALIDYAGAAAYFEEAGNVSGVAHAYNNRASVLRRLKQYDDAHEAADRALTLLSKGDPFIANFLDQKAQVYLAEERFTDAERIAREAVALVENTDRQGVLCESLCTLGRACAGQGNHREASAAFARAEQIVENINSLDMRFALTRARRDAAKEFLRATEVELAELALKMSNGMVRAAAKRLNLAHSKLGMILKRGGVKWKSKKPQSIISKRYK